jgi:hypothetical protein
VAPEKQNSIEVPSVAMDGPVSKSAEKGQGDKSGGSQQEIRPDDESHSNNLGLAAESGNSNAMLTFGSYIKPQGYSSSYGYQSKDDDAQYLLKNLASRNTPYTSRKNQAFSSTGLGALLNDRSHD